MVDSNPESYRAMEWGGRNIYGERKEALGMICPHKNTVRTVDLPSAVYIK